MVVEDLILNFTRGVGSRTIVHLLDLYGSAERVFAASKDELVEHAELRPDIAERILRKEAMEVACREIEYCRKHRIYMIAATDDEYPLPLREIGDRPHVLFVRGNIAALSQRLLSMVGTRDMSPSGNAVCNRIVQQLGQSVDQLCIVSGLAYGVDAACHRAALTYGVNTVAVIASALPSVTPAAHNALANDIVEHGGAIISELSSQSPQNGSHFLARNRIIAGLSMGTLVVESPATGGSLATANMADGYGRMVMAIPGRITDASSFGTNNLIRSGKARLVLTASDIIDDMGWGSSVDSVDEVVVDDRIAALNPDERLIYDAISQSVTITIAEILDKTNLSMGTFAMAVMTLELQGLVRKLPGQRYEKI